MKERNEDEEEEEKEEEEGQCGRGGDLTPITPVSRVGSVPEEPAYCTHRHPKECRFKTQGAFSPRPPLELSPELN
ncbi:hypothetical protein ElyMa_000315600 [Elysia marginata]|uniref:CTNNB1 binding N-teminal domain-containing protein n=1 Tax=Elysia marginata TaxID=1093978 RepID=A0AAV4F9C4_9GAST|nr:hypothetical protein ElyMa_000315600 [Elysia marginata]